LLLYKDTKGWNVAKDGVINHDFFKWLENLPKSGLKKLALHLLSMMPNRKLPHLKVFMKKISEVAINCYSAKEWLVKIKRK